MQSSTSHDPKTLQFNPDVKAVFLLPVTTLILRPMDQEFSTHLSFFTLEMSTGM
jgi:hypothetical protein